VQALLSVTASVAMLFAATSASAQMKPDTVGMATQSIEVTARPIATFARSGQDKPNPKLEWRGGLALTSSSQYFGGWSGLLLSNDGKSLVAVSDAGMWMKGEIAYENDRPTAFHSVRVGALKALKGATLRRTRDRDAEAITLAGGSLSKGMAYIAFEQNDRIGVFPLAKDGVGTPAKYLEMPKEAKRMRMDGIEALTVLAGGPSKGALVAIAENPLRGEKQHRGWIWLSNGGPKGFWVAAIGDYGITDAASLADGSVLILERRFRWFEGVKIRLRRLAADGLEPGGSAAGEILLEADSAMQIDNLEGLAVTEGAQGETVITLMSDDNFNRFLQRTVLLQFTLKDPPGPSRKVGSAAPR
jgi:hypothetical protein